MKLRFLVTICALAIVAATPAAAAAESQAPVYYLSLGDSLAAGTQPGREFTNEGYADQLAAALRTKMPTLQLVKLGCPGEATTSMITPDLPFEGRTGHNACRAISCSWLPRPGSRASRAAASASSSVAR